MSIVKFKDADRGRLSWVHFGFLRQDWSPNLRHPKSVLRVGPILTCCDGFEFIVTCAQQRFEVDQDGSQHIYVVDKEMYDFAAALAKEFCYEQEQQQKEQQERWRSYRPVGCSDPQIYRVPEAAGSGSVGTSSPEGKGSDGGSNRC